jgi:ketol-acid reductoisomerase
MNPYKTFKTLIPKIHTYNIQGTFENVLNLTNLKLHDTLAVVKHDKISVLGYGSQGRGQALNLRDQNYPVILGLRKNGNSWNHAVSDGWVPNTTLFDIETALQKGTIYKYLLSDAGQIQQWDTVKKYLTPDKTLYFSHGFGIVYKEQTKIVPPSDIDIIMVAPKGPGTLVRENFLLGNKGINASYAIHQDHSGTAMDKVLSLSYGIGSKYLFNTTFKKEVYSDLTGERSVLMGMIQGAFKAQFDLLRQKGHSPMESYNETVEEATNCLYQLIDKHGMPKMFRDCSTTAQRGAIDWSTRYYDAIKPVIAECYESVASGEEARRVISSNSDPNYRAKLDKELREIEEQEIWVTGEHVRELRTK